MPATLFENGWKMSSSHGVCPAQVKSLQLCMLTQHRSQMSAESAQIDDAFSKLYRCSPVKERGEPRYPLHRFAWKNRRSRRSHRRHCNRRRHNHNQSHAVIVAIVIAIVVIIVAIIVIAISSSSSPLSSSSSPSLSPCRWSCI